MELVAENGHIVSLSKGCRKELGRGSELGIHDKTVSRHQILLELQEPSKEARSMGSDTYFGLSVKVLGANPVCIVHIGQSVGRRSNGQEMTLLRKGDMDTLYPGDKISLSLSLPMFLTVRQGGGRKGINGSENNKGASSSAVVALKEEMPTSAECSKQLAEDDLLRKWKNRKNEKKTTDHAETLDKRQISADEDVASNEEEAGIAQAVARRQKRALERRRQEEQNGHEKHTRLMEELENVPKGEREASKLEEELFVKTENIDPVKEFGFLVEGLEFEQYKKRHKPDGGRWVWPPAAKSPAESGSDEDDEDQQERRRQSRKGKRKVDEDDDEEWKGDDQDEKVALASAKKRKGAAKVNLRSHEPSSSKKKDTDTKKAVSGRMSKDQREEMEDEDEDEDETDETLGGFIVNDNEEDDPLDDSTDDEEDEDSDNEDVDEDLDEAEEEDEEEEGAKRAKSKKKKEEKPLCKYGKNCYRKNRDHLAQYRH